MFLTHMRKGKNKRFSRYSWNLDGHMIIQVRTPPESKTRIKTLLLVVLMMRKEL